MLTDVTMIVFVAQLRPTVVGLNYLQLFKALFEYPVAILCLRDTVIAVITGNNNLF